MAFFTFMWGCGGGFDILKVSPTWVCVRGQILKVGWSRADQAMLKFGRRCWACSPPFCVGIFSFFF